MNAPGEHDEWARRAKECFDESVEGLDARTLSRLNRARREALAAGAPGALPARRYWAPLSGLLAALAIGALVVLGPASREPPLPEPVDSDIELLLGEDNFEMLEDLEFYYWMHQLRQDAGNARG